MNFKELPPDGQAFEQLIRELLFSQGLHVEWSGRGPDGGRDLICRETLRSHFANSTKTWLVQCKHKAHSGDSVSVGELDDIVSSCTQHGASGYLLACSTQPSSALVNRLEGITNNPSSSITATYWDGVALERMLSQPRQWAIAQRFMPKSCDLWKIYATEAPNDFVVHYKGYVFHLTNRIGSNVKHEMRSISKRITELECIELPEGHFIRPRAVWHNEKAPEYVWYIDYMRPDGEPAAITRAELLVRLWDGWALDDGAAYSWDISFIKYNPSSDFYDKDSYNYYTRYMPNFLTGTMREFESRIESYWATQQEIERLQEESSKLKTDSFNKMIEAFKLIPFVKILSSFNASPEAVVRLERRYDWSDLKTEIDFVHDNVFTSVLVMTVSDVSKFFELLASLPNGVERHFRVSRVFLFLPEVGLATKRNEYLFDLRFSLHPCAASNQRDIRSNFNKYFEDISKKIKERFH